MISETARPRADKKMRILWWLHRTLMILFIPCGAIIGCVLVLYSLNFVEDLVGNIALALYPIGFILGAYIPRLVFYKLSA